MNRTASAVPAPPVPRPNEGNNVAPAVQPDAPAQQAHPIVPTRTIDLSVANLLDVFRGDGTGLSVKDFFRLFENAAATGRWSKEDMVRLLQMKVKGSAATFLSTLLDLHGPEVIYDDIKKINDRTFHRKTFTTPLFEPIQCHPAEK